MDDAARVHRHPLDERDFEWFESKYPGWNDTFGKVWDVMIDNFVNGRGDKTVPGTLPIICNVSQLPIVGTPYRSLKDTSLVYVLSIPDFLGAASKVAQRDGRLVEMYTFVAVVYFVLCCLLSWLARQLHKRVAIVR